MILLTMRYNALWIALSLFRANLWHFAFISLVQFKSNLKRFFSFYLKRTTRGYLDKYNQKWLNQRMGFPRKLHIWAYHLINEKTESVEIRTLGWSIPADEAASQLWCVSVDWRSVSHIRRTFVMAVKAIGGFISECYWWTLKTGG